MGNLEVVGGRAVAPGEWNFGVIWARTDEREGRAGRQFYIAMCVYVVGNVDDLS